MYIVRLYTETTDVTAARRHRLPERAIEAAAKALRDDPALLCARVMTPDRKLLIKCVERET
jgi:hypothetical protein